MTVLVGMEQLRVNPFRLVPLAGLCVGGICLGQNALPSAWYVRAAPNSNPLNAITYGQGLFVAAGGQGSLLTSPDGSNWAQAAGSLLAVTFHCAAFGDEFYLGGEGAALISYSADGTNWTAGLSTNGQQQVVAILNRSGVQALQWDPVGGSSLLSSWDNGVDWSSSSLPTTNMLFAMTVGRLGNSLSAPDLYLAVGAQGTILTSADGLHWSAQSSGTRLALRAAVFHQGRILAGGESGAVLTSTNGVSWSAAAPTSFDIRGFASSGNAVVAVGSYGGAGRVQASLDGLTWPGTAVAFAAPVNAVAYGGSTFVAVGDGGAIIQSDPVVDGSVNSWTNRGSGYWEEPYWSCGRLPAADQGLIAFTNAGWKALAIGPNTTANFADSLTIKALDVEAPSNSFNELPQ